MGGTNHDRDARGVRAVSAAADPYGHHPATASIVVRHQVARLRVSSEHSLSRVLAFTAYPFSQRCRQALRASAVVFYDQDYVFAGDASPLLSGIVTVIVVPMPGLLSIVRSPL